jgi:hypothetical protein
MAPELASGISAPRPSTRYEKTSGEADETLPSFPDEGSFMRPIGITLVLVLSLALAGGAIGQSNPASSSRPNEPGGAKNAPVIQTEKIQVPESLQTPPATMASQPGYMLPAQATQLLVKIWQTESRVRDLMSQAHPALLEMPQPQAVALGRQMMTIGQNLNTLETARAEFAGRVDSEYLGFKVFAALSNLLPPLSTTGDMVYRYGSPQLGSMFKQAWNDMFTLQEALQPYVAFLARNHDQIYALMQGNLYACQNQLNAAMRTHPRPTRLIRNIVPFKPRRARQPAAKHKAAQKQ